MAYGGGYGGTSGGGSGYGGAAPQLAPSGGGGGGGGWSWTNPIHDISNVYNYINPIGGLKQLGGGLATMVATPLVDLGYGAGALGAAGIDALHGDTSSARSSLAAAGRSAYGAVQSLGGSTLGLGEAYAGLAADILHPIPGLGHAFDSGVQAVNRGLQTPNSDLGWNKETEAMLGGPDGNGAKPQDLLQMAKHQGLFSSVIMQTGLAAPIGGAIEGAAGAAAEGADAAAASGDAAGVDATLAGAQTAADPPPGTAFNWRQPLGSTAKMFGESIDSSGLAPEDAAARAAKLHGIESVGKVIHHPWGFLGSNIAGFLKANDIAAKAVPEEGLLSPPTAPTPETATPEQIAAAVAAQDPTIGAAETVAATQASVKYNISEELQASLDAASAHVATLPQVDVNAPPEPGMVRLYNGGSGDQSMWTEKLSRAESYKGATGELRHIDVPEAQAATMRAAGEGAPAELAARTAGHQPTEGDYFLGPHPQAYGEIVDHPAEPQGYQGAQGPKRNVQETPGLTPSGKEDALSHIAKAEGAAQTEFSPPEALDKIGQKVAMPPPAWATRIADALPPSVNRAFSHFGMGLVDRSRFNEARMVMSHAMETAQNRARTSPLMNAGRSAAVDVLTNTDLGISREAAFRFVGEDVAAAVTGEQLAAEFVAKEGWNPMMTSTLGQGGMAVEIPAIAADVRAALMDRARNGYEGLPERVRNQMPPEARAAYDTHVDAAVQGYKQAVNETMQALLATRFGAHGFESALVDPNAPIMSPGDVKDYQRVMSDMRREQVYRSKQPTLVEAAKAAFKRQVALGEKQSGIVRAMQDKLGLTLQTVADLHQGIPPGIRPENIDATVQATLDAAAASEQATGFYGTTIDPSTGEAVVHVKGYNVGVAKQFDVPKDQWNADAPNLIKRALQTPLQPDGVNTYDAAQLWGGADSHLGIWQHTMPDGTVMVSGDISIDTIAGKPLNLLQARVLGEGLQQEALWDNAGRTEIRLSGAPAGQNLFADYIDHVLDPQSNLNKFTDRQLTAIDKLRNEIPQPVGAVRVVPSEADVAQAVQAMMHFDHAFAEAGSGHQLGDLFNVDVKPAVSDTGATLKQTSMPFDMTTAQGVANAFQRYDTASVAKYMQWYFDSNKLIEDSYRGQTFPLNGRDAAEVFYDVLAVTSVMASPLQNLGRALSSFSNMEDFLSGNKDAMAAAQSVMDRAMKLPPDVTYVQNIGKGEEGTPYFGSESLPGEDTQKVVTRGKGTAVPTRFFETPEFRKLTERTSMTTGPKAAVVDILFGKLNIGDATNEEIAQQPGNWTKAKTLSDANLPVGRIRYWANQLGIESPALQHLTELEQQVNDLQANRARPNEPQNVSPYVSDQARVYAKEQGLPTPRTTNLQAEVNPVRGRVIADFYAKAESNPNDPAVVKAYNAFANEVIDQWEFLKKQGVNVEFVGRNPETGGAYPDNASMVQDVQQNHHLFVDRTGPGEEHLMPEMNAVVDHTPDGQDITTNDAFRAVHDYFGHAQAGNTFDRHGEDIAWRLHRQMFSKEAQPALFTETVGQNSYLNFHPENFARRAAGEEAQFPEQKATLLPEKVQKPTYLPTITEAKAALRDTMHDPSLAPAYEQAMLEHGGQSSWAKLRSFRSNLSNPGGSLAVTQDSVMAQFYGMRATDWNLKRFPGENAPPEEGSVWANKSDEVRQEAQALGTRLKEPVTPNQVQALLWVYTKEFIGTQDWGRLVAHNDAANAVLDTLEQTIKSGGTVDASTVHPLADWWDEELAFGRAYSMLQSERASLEALQKSGEILNPAEQARLDELSTIEHRSAVPIKVDINANARADLHDTANAVLQDQTRYQIADAGEINAKEQQYKKYIDNVEKPMQAAIAKGDVEGARIILDEYVAKWEKSIKGDAEGGNFSDVAKKSMASKADSTRLAVERLQEAKYVPKPNSTELSIGELHDAFGDKVKGSVTIDPGQTGRLMMKLFHGADLSTLMHEGGHLARLMAPGDDVALLSNYYPHIQDSTLTAARVADEERFVADMMTYLHTGAASGRVPPALEPIFTQLARSMSNTYGPAFEMPGGQAVPQDIVNYFDGIFHPETQHPTVLTDPLALQQLDRPGGANPVRRPWESPSDFTTRARQLGEQRVQSATDAAKLRAETARLGKINAATDSMLKVLDLGGEAGLANLAKADKLAASATAGLDKLAEVLDNAEGRQVPKVWRSMLSAFQGVAELAKSDQSGQLAEHLGEIPDNFRKVLEYAAARGFEPTYVPDLTWQMAAKHLFNHLNLSSSLEEAGLRKENTGVLERQGNVDRSLEALGSAQVVAMKELYQDQLVAHIEKYYAQPHTPGDPIPDGYKAWDPIRQGIILGRDRMGNVTSVNATAVVPEGVDGAIKAMSQDFTKWPFRFLFKGGPTQVWKNILMTYSPGWYIKHFTGTAILTAGEGVRMSDFMVAFKKAVAKDEFGFHWADVPDEIKGRSIYTEMGSEIHKPGSSAIVPLRDIARNEGLREAAKQVQYKMRNVVNTIDALGRTAVYVKTLRETGDAGFAAERAAKATGDFLAMGPFERGIVSAVLPFYSFQKAMFKILVRLPLDHPFAAALFMQAEQMHRSYMEQQLGGPLPDQLIGSTFINGQLTSIAKVNPLTDAYRLITPEGIAQSAHPLIQLAIQDAFGSPSFNGGGDMGTYGQLVQKPDWFHGIADSFTNSALGTGAGGVAQGDLGALGEALVPRIGRTWSQAQYDQLIKRIAKTQAALSKLGEPGAYISPPDVVVPSQSQKPVYGG